MHEKMLADVVKKREKDLERKSNDVGDNRQNQTSARATTHASCVCWPSRSSCMTWLLSLRSMQGAKLDPARIRGPNL